MTNRLGMGVMIQRLFGDERSAEALQSVINHDLIEIQMVGDDAIVLWFTDKTGLRIWDNGQSCCESRYMVCDDDLAAFVPSQFLGLEVLNGPNIESPEDHEQQFLVIKTSKGSFTVTNHNEHNGYYGGFSLTHETVMRTE